MMVCIIYSDNPPTLVYVRVTVCMSQRQPKWRQLLWMELQNINKYANCIVVDPASLEVNMFLTLGWTPQQAIAQLTGDSRYLRFNVLIPEDAKVVIEGELTVKITCASRENHVITRCPRAVLFRPCGTLPMVAPEKYCTWTACYHMIFTWSARDFKPTVTVNVTR